MADEPVQVVIAPRAEAKASLPSNWQDEITSIDGISQVGSTVGRLQVRATPQGLAAARSRFGQLLHFEEVTPRSFP